MKYFSIPLIFTCILLLTTSCEKNDSIESLQKSNQEFVDSRFTSVFTRVDDVECKILSRKELIKIGNALSPHIEQLEKLEDAELDETSYNRRRSFIEQQIKIVLSPLRNSADSLYNSIVRCEENTTDMEVKNAPIFKKVRNYSEVERTECFFNFNVACLDAYDRGQFLIYPRVQPSIDSKIIKCLLFALGIDDMVDIINLIAGGGSPSFIVKGTKMLISSKTALQILKSFGMRYAGWIGVGYSIYQFAQCMQDQAE